MKKTLLVVSGISNDLFKNLQKIDNVEIIEENIHENEMTFDMSKMCKAYETVNDKFDKQTEAKECFRKFINKRK